MKSYVVDTHAWVYYLLNELPDGADKAFYEAERGNAIIYIPTIVLAECVYLAERGRISLDYSELLTGLKIAKNFISIPLTLEIVEEMINIPLSDIHDRIIVATAKLTKSILVTRDKEIINLGIVKTVWNNW